MRISDWSSDVCSSDLIGDYLRVNEQAAPFSLLRVEQNAYVAVYNTCITGNAAIIAGVSALAGLPGLSNICTGVRGNAGSSTGVQPYMASQDGQHLPYAHPLVVRNADGSTTGREACGDKRRP